MVLELFDPLASDEEPGGPQLPGPGPEQDRPGNLESFGQLVQQSYGWSEGSETGRQSVGREEGGALQKDASDVDLYASGLGGLEEALLMPAPVQQA